MKRILRISQAIALSVLLACTSHAMAQARGQTQASGKMVICTGLGPRVIYVDADGLPTQPPYICPDCALSLMQGLPAQDVALTGLFTWHKIKSERDEQAVLYAAAHAPQARGPPWRL